MASRPRGFDSPEAMFAAWRGRQRRYAVRDTEMTQAAGATHITPPAPGLAETSQEPRQWNMVTIKRCTVTMAEYRYYGTVETVLQQKGFPAGVPEDGTILLSWFDQAEGTACYELARMQDQGELTAYMLEHFKPQQDEGLERTIAFE